MLSSKSLHKNPPTCGHMKTSHSLRHFPFGSLHFGVCLFSSGHSEEHTRRLSLLFIIHNNTKRKKNEESDRIQHDRQTWCWKRPHSLKAWTHAEILLVSSPPSAGAWHRSLFLFKYPSNTVLPFPFLPEYVSHPACP